MSSLKFDMNTLNAHRQAELLRIQEQTKAVEMIIVSESTKHDEACKRAYEKVYVESGSFNAIYGHIKECYFTMDMKILWAHKQALKAGLAKQGITLHREYCSDNYADVILKPTRYQ